MKRITSFMKHGFFRVFLHVVSAILVFLFVSRRVQIGDVRMILAQFHLPSLVPLALFASLAFAALSLRWRTLLALVDIHVSLKEIVLTNGRSIFYGLFLPGHVTSDLLKGWMIDRQHQEGDMGKIAFSVLVDKMLGFAALSIVGAGALLYTSLVSRTWALMTGALVFGLLVSIHQAFFRIPLTWIARWKALRFLETARQKNGVNGALLIACGWSLVSQISIAISAAALAWGLGITQPFLVMIGYVLSAFLTALPITFAGIGVREGVFVWLLQKEHILPVTSIILSEGLLLMNVLYGMVTWLYRPLMALKQKIQEKNLTIHHQRFLFSIGLALLLLFPSMLFQLGKSYKGIYVSASSDEVHYVSMIREVSEGHLLHANTYIFEERDGAPNIFQWNEVLVGELFRVWPWSVDWFVWCVKFVSLALSAWFLSGFLTRWRPEMRFFWIATAVFAWFVLPAFLGSAFLTRAIEAFTWSGHWDGFLPGFRFINPIVSVLLFFSGIALLERLHKQPSVLCAAALGAMIALTNYMYIYFWMALCVYIGLWLLIYLVQKDWNRVKIVSVSLLVGAVLSLPFWIFIKQELRAFALQTPLAISSHTLIIEKAIWVSVLIFLSWTVWRAKKKHEPFNYGTLSLCILGATAFLAVNQHVITGHVVQPHHFYWMVDLPVAGFLLIVTIEGISKVILPRISQRFGGAAALCVVAFLGFAVQAQTIKNVAPEYQDLQRLKPAFTFINQRQTDKVIYSDDRISELVPMYTGSYVSYALHATAYLTTSQERRRWAVFVRLFLGGASDADKIQKKMIEERDRIGAEIFEGQHYREACGSYGCFPQEIFDQLVKETQELLKQDFETVLFRYRLDAILWDEKIHQEWNLSRFPFLKKVWERDGVSIWERRV